MNRRKLLRLGAGLGALAGVGAFARWRFLPPGPSATLAPVDELARALFASLDAEQRAGACVEYDHPLRQYHNRGVWAGGLGVFDGFSRRQRAWISDLFHAGLSPAGRERLPREFYLRLAGVHALNLLLCGDPERPPYQAILSGPHANLRLGGVNREGVAFGGPQVYGDQRGDGRAGLPGNVFRAQFVLAERLLATLDARARAEATLPEAPPQTAIEPLGPRGPFPGTLVRGMENAARVLVADLVAEILSSYPPADAAYAQECLTVNGGLDALSFAVYEHGEDGPIPTAQVFRLEGPAAVFHFRGHPHVHAFVHVARDPERPFSVGRELGHNPTRLAGEGVRALFERALLDAPDTDLAWFPPESVVGPLRAGSIRAGDLYVLESWQDDVVQLELRGAALGPVPRAALAARGEALEPERLYRVATTGFAARERRAELGRAEEQRTGPKLRERAIEHLARRGFPG